MPVAPLTTVPSIAAAGIDDAVFVKILRDDMDDPPIPVQEVFNTTALTPFIRLSQFPVYDNDAFLQVMRTGPNPLTYQLVPSRKDLVKSNQAYVEYDTGFVYFSDPSQTAPIVVNHYRVRWLDRRMRNALYAGLKAMFPRIWQLKNFVFQVQVNQWEYTLPADFFDPRCRILRVEYQEIPFATERYHRMNDWFQPSYNIIHIPWSQSLTPGANVRVTYAGPYNSLSELEPQVMHLPLWYAKGKLLLDKEVLRSRYDMGPVAQNEQQYPPGISANAGIYHLRQFEAELERLAKPMPVAAVASVYGR